MNWIFLAISKLNKEFFFLQPNNSIYNERREWNSGLTSQVMVNYTSQDVWPMRWMWNKCVVSCALCRDGTRTAGPISAGAVEKERQVQGKDNVLCLPASRQYHSVLTSPLHWDDHFHCISAEIRSLSVVRKLNQIKKKEAKKNFFSFFFLQEGRNLRSKCSRIEPRKMIELKNIDHRFEALRFDDVLTVVLPWILELRIGNWFKLIDLAPLAIDEAENVLFFSWLNLLLVSSLFLLFFFLYFLHFHSDLILFHFRSVNAHYNGTQQSSALGVGSKWIIVHKAEAVESHKCRRRLSLTNAAIGWRKKWHVDAGPSKRLWAHKPHSRRIAVIGQFKQFLRCWKWWT